MSASQPLNVSLTPELDAFVRDRVEAGRYVSSSEVVREGLRLLQEREREVDEAVGILSKRLELASAQADRGELRDGEAFFDRLLKRIHSGSAK
jgi:antitoxin ParD1/3/4